MLAIEVLEERSLLAGLTIIVHGWEPFGRFPDWPVSIASDINDHLLVPAGASKCSGTEIQNSVAGPRKVPEGPSCEHFLVVDWASLSNDLFLQLSGAFETENWLFNAIQSTLLATAEPLDYLHLIGHSRGGSVTGEVVSRLSNAGLLADAQVDWVQVTLLDPLAVIFPLADSFPEGISSVAGVDRVENYYQTDGVPGTQPPFSRQGEQIKDAVNVDLTDTLRQWDSGAIPHSEVHMWYRGAVDFYKDHDIDSTPGLQGRESLFQGVVLPFFREARLVSDPAPDPGFPPIRAPDAPAGTRDDYATPPRRNDVVTITLPSSLSTTRPGAIEFVGDRDWFQVRTVRDGILKVEVGTLGSLLDSFVTVFDANLNPIDSDDNNGPGTDAQVFLDVRANETYFIEVAGAGISTGSYHLLVSQPDSAEPDPANQPPPPQPVVDDFPDRYEDAVEVALDSLGFASRSGTIDGNSHSLSSDSKDHDWFLVEAVEDGPMLIEVLPQSALDALVRVHGPDSKTLKVDDDPDPGVALIDVRAGQSFRIDIGPNTSGLTFTGGYVVRISQPDATDLPGNSGTDGPPGPLPGWGGVRGVQINLANGNGNSRGSIDSPGEVDWYQIDGALASNMQIVVAGTNDDLTEFLTVFRADGSPVDTDSGVDDGIARSCFTVGAGERIIAAVTSHEGRSRGPYTITVSQPDGCPADDIPNTKGEARDIGGELTDEGNGFVRARLDPASDVDWFKIPVRRSGRMQVEVDQRNSTLLSFLTLERDVPFETEPGDDGLARVTFSATVGETIWAKVEGMHGTVGPYTLLVRQNVLDPEDDHADLADQSGQAGRGGTPIVLDAHAAGTITGTIHHPKDRDSFEVTAVRDGFVNIEVVPTSGTLRPFLQATWFDRDLGRTEGNTDVASGRGRNPHMCLHGLRAGDKAYFRVWADGNATIGDYLVYVWQSETCPAQWQEDPQEIGPFLPALALDGWGNGQFAAGIDFAGDRDTFRIDVVRTGLLTIQVMPPAGGNDGVDAFVTVYDASGQSILTSHDAAVLPDGRLMSGSTQVTLDGSSTPFVGRFRQQP